MRTSYATTNQRLRNAMFKAHKGKCFYTGLRLEESDFHIDHIKPAALGGAHCISNYVLCRPDINILKSSGYDESLCERMLYLNKVTFVPVVERLLKSEKNSAPRRSQGNTKTSGQCKKLDVHVRWLIKNRDYIHSLHGVSVVEFIREKGLEINSQILNSLGPRIRNDFIEECISGGFSLPCVSGRPA